MKKKRGEHWLGQKVLLAMREWPTVGPVKAADLVAKIDGSYDSITGAASDLVSRGLLKRPAKGYYRLTERGAAIDLRGVLRPSTIATAAKAKDLRAQFWRMLRLRGTLSVRDAVLLICEAGSITNHSYDWLITYCAALNKAGYLANASRVQPHAARDIRWRLTRDTGPASPKIDRRKLIIDRNNGDVWPI